MASQAVAVIVAETMNNFLLSGHLLKCQVSLISCGVRGGADVQLVPEEEVHPKLWEGANKKWHKIPRARIEKLRQERVSLAIDCRAELMRPSLGRTSRSKRLTRSCWRGRRRADGRSRMRESTTSLRDM